jgi:hypothetical protein
LVAAAQLSYQYIRCQSEFLWMNFLVSCDMCVEFI